MRPDTLDILRCPYCGGRLEVVTSLFHRFDGEAISEAILGCHCCVFPVVAGIPVLHLEPAAVRAKEQVEAGQPDLALRTLVGLDDEEAAGRFEAAIAPPDATYREVVDALGPGFEGGYFLYRFGDPTYVVASTVVGGVAFTVLDGSGRAIDVCGGSGHLTRVLLEASPAPPIVADLFFAKLWLARRFTAPGCEPVCCDGNAPLPFATGAFRFSVCSDAYHYIWHKRLFADEMMRLVGGSAGQGAAVITHAHNAAQWNPSAGMPLPADAYRELFAAMRPRLFAEGALLTDIVETRGADLARRDDAAALAADPALTLVASARDDVYRRVAVQRRTNAQGAFRVNPLYTEETVGDEVTLRLRFPSADYEHEYGAARRYLPESATAARAALAALPARHLPASLATLADRRVILDLPERYY